MITLKNENLTVRIKPFGAELSGISSNQTGREYLWQGDPAVWAGQAPVLFPIVSRLSSDSFFHEGKQYFLPKHGFARKSAFAVDKAEETEAVFSLTSSDETHRVYPFDFRLTVGFSLDGNTVTATHTVENTGNAEMHFSIGAHPAFNLNLGDIVRFAEAETLTTCLWNEYGLYYDEKTIATDCRDVEITEHLFDDDALFFRDLKSTSATIVQKDGTPVLEMTYDKVPFLGLWAKPGASFVCIEPWHGIADTPAVSGVLSEKPYMLHLPAGETFRFTYSVKIL